MKIPYHSYCGTPDKVDLAAMQDYAVKRQLGDTQYHELPVSTLIHFHKYSEPCFDNAGNCLEHELYAVGKEGKEVILSNSMLKGLLDDKN